MMRMGNQAAHNQGRYDADFANHGLEAQEMAMILREAVAGPITDLAEELVKSGKPEQLAQVGRKWCMIE